MGIIVGYHAMPIDNEVIDKMREYSVASRQQVEDSLKDNQHNPITALYYLIQKKVLRAGNKTVVDLQAYLETNEKYRRDYGKESLGKF